jgi:hypothetical protein
MAGAARKKRLLTYSELAQLIQSVQFDAHDPRLANLLGQVSCLEHAAGRGMLSSVIVNQSERVPGHGYFNLARELGFQIESGGEEEFWSRELEKVYGIWSKR